MYAWLSALSAGSDQLLSSRCHARLSPSFACSTCGRGSRDVQDFRNLSVWVKAHKMALDVYVVSARLLTRREFSLRNQIVRAAVSVPANIAEGCGRSGVANFAGSAASPPDPEASSMYHLLLAKDLGFLPAPEYERLTTQVVEVKRMLSGFIRTLETSAE